MTSPPPLAVYVHWPYCARICPYCDFNVVRDRGQAEQADLAAAIVHDLAGQAARIAPRRLSSVFFGGGTPSLMRPEWIAEILAEARALWPPDGPVEVSLEANPTDAEAARFAAEAGVARLSLGVQSLDDATLAFLGRNHGAAEARRALDLALAAFPRVSADLIYAVPGQTADAWAGELTALARTGVEHISPYQLTLEPQTAFGRAVRRGRLVAVEEGLAADLYETTQSVLEAEGFDAYEVSNHARGPDARSAHNLAYWRGWDYVGAGPGAHGRLTTPEGRLATEAEPRVPDYIARVATTGAGFAQAEALSPTQVAQERLLLGLRSVEGVALADLAALELDPAKLKAFAQEGLLALPAGRLVATPRGRAVLDRLCFDLAA